MDTHYLNGSKICKVYLTKESEERLPDANRFYTYGKVMKMTTEKESNSEGIFVREFLYLEPCDSEPEKIDYYREDKQVELKGNFTIFKH